MEIYVRVIHNDTIKPFENGGLAIIVDSVIHKVLIIDTKLRSFIPPQVHKMTPKYVRFVDAGFLSLLRDMRFSSLPRICRLV